MREPLYGTTTLPDALTTLGNRVFSGCIRLTSITLPDALTTLGDRVFSGCTRLKAITLPDALPISHRMRPVHIQQMTRLF